MSNISKNVLKKIDEKEITPRPKWQFILSHILLWGVFGVSIILGSIATSLVLAKLFANDWTLIPRLPGGPIRGFLLVLPYLWIAVMALMIFIASQVFTKTKKGYKHHPWIIVALSILVSITLGSILFATRTADYVENAMRMNIKPYQQYQELRERIWHAPDNGILPGKIIKITSDKLIILNDLTGKTWNVDISEAMYPHHMELEEGSNIIAVGDKTSETEFKADILKPAPIFKDRLKNLKQNGRSKPI
jgi:hypothetical protein